MELEDLLKKNKLTEKQLERLQELKKILESNDVVQRYMALLDEEKKLRNELLNLRREIKFEEYEACSHVLVYSSRDGHRECVKCGLRDDVGVYNSILEVPWHSIDGIMYEFLKMYDFSGLDTDIACDPALAHAIYKRLQAVHPKISDEEILKYLQNALLHISTIPVNEERKQSRARRLSLNPDFSGWNSRHF